MTDQELASLVAPCPDAFSRLGQIGAADVMAAFEIANILHTQGHLVAAAALYRRAYALHSKNPGQFPTAHGLLQASLICLVKASEPIASGDIDELRALCTPYADYILGACEVFSPRPDYLKALKLFRNCFEEFHTGEECDTICLTAASRYFDTPQAGVVPTHGAFGLPPAQAIPRRLFFYWDRDPPPEIAENFEYHKALASFDVEIFDLGRGAEFMYNYFGVEAREMFLNTRHPAEAADILRPHVIYTYGGYWLDADMKIRSLEKFRRAIPVNFESVFCVTPSHVVHNDFFGAQAGNGILADCMLSITRNCYLHGGLYIAYKTGPGVFARALNRAYYKALTGAAEIPHAKILPQTAFDEALESYPVSYKHGAGSWHTV